MKNEKLTVSESRINKDDIDICDMVRVFAIGIGSLEPLQYV
jgi:hypothetical protein